MTTLMDTYKESTRDVQSIIARIVRSCPDLGDLPLETVGKEGFDGEYWIRNSFQIDKAMMGRDDLIEDPLQTQLNAYFPYLAKHIASYDGGIGKGSKLVQAEPMRFTMAGEYHDAQCHMITFLFEWGVKVVN